MHHGFQTLALSALLLAAATGAAPSSPPAAPAAPSPAPTPTPNPAILARSKALYRALQIGKIDRTQLTAKASADVTDDTLKAVAARIAPLGEPVTFEQFKVVTQDGSTFYGYALSFGDGTKLDLIVGYDAQGKVSALALRPAS